MKIRPGRTRSLFVGIMMIVVIGAGVAIMTRFGGPTGGVFGPFIIIWVVVGLVGAAMAFYNALSEQGLPLYEVDTEEDLDTLEGEESDAFCPHCGKPVGVGDQFCRHCGGSLGE